MGQLSSVLQQLQQKGLLPMLLQKMKQAQAQPGAAPGVGGAPPGGQAQPAPSITQAAPGGGGQASGASSGGPQVKYDPSGAGASMPPPISQPHEAVQSIAGLLMNWNQRKKKGEEAEAANIAQNLIQALRNNDKDTVNDIMNNDHSKKILNKVYKGWLTKAQDAQKPGKEQDPVVSGFEAGIQKATQQSQQQQAPKGQLPMNAPGGYRMPQPGQSEQLGAAKSSAELQAAKDDPNRLLTSQLTSGEKRETELGAGPEKIQAEREKFRAAAQKAVSDLQRAQLEATKAETELRIKETEARSAEAKGKVSADIEHQKYLKSLVDLDIAKWRLKNTIAKPAKQLPIQDRLKVEAISKAESIVNSIIADKRSFSASDVQALQQELKAAGADSLGKSLPGIMARSLIPGFIPGSGGTKDVQTLANSLKSYKESFRKALDDAYPGWDKEVKPSAEKKIATGAEGSEDGDEVDADIIVNPEDMEEKPPTK